MKSFFLLTVVLLHIPSFAQQLRTYNGQYTLNAKTTGTANYGYYAFPNDSIQFHGRFAFTSDVLQFENNKVRQVNTSGTYRRGLKNGDWVYERNDFNVQFKRISGVNIESVLDGTINRLNARYNNGLAEGRWSLITQQVRESRRRTNYASSEANFRAGKASGRFIFNDPGRVFPLSIEGQFDNEGNFNGLWKLSFELDGIRYDEEREYEQGFLIRLTQTNSITGEIYFNEEYIDVRSKLEFLKNTDNGANYKMGERRFGLYFNDGYRLEDIRIVAQEFGNEILKEAFDYYTDSSGVLFTLPGFEKPIIGTTRRFQYVYPENEPELIEVLRPMVQKMADHYDSLLNTSVLRINRQKSDTLAYYYELLELGLSKTKLIMEVLDEVESGRFDYQYRDNFYPEGVAGLTGKDTIKYKVFDKEVTGVVSFNDAVDKPDSLIFNIYRYAISMEAYIEDYDERVKKTIQSLQREERVAQLDEKIVNLLDTFLLTYTGNPKISLTAADNEIVKLKPLNDLQLAVFKRYTREVLNRNMQEYIEIEDFDRKILQGNKIADLVKTLTDNYQTLYRIPQLAEELDEVYTRYTPNPFFERDVVTRIKQGIYSRGVELLLPQLIEDLKKTSTREEFLEQIELIFKLDDKLRELAQSDDQETNRLNSRIRRENQPERIKRLLGLS
ncbi:MAG TPA: hypothetical protein PKC24_02655 [Cyclobacteriaceae bacterium]|nr:hypothetical protein [Cyclobacteriaceae bacterium]